MFPTLGSTMSLSAGNDTMRRVFNVSATFAPVVHKEARSATCWMTLDNGLNARTESTARMYGRPSSRTRAVVAMSPTRPWQRPSLRRVEVSPASETSAPGSSARLSRSPQASSSEDRSRLETSRDREVTWALWN